MLSWRQGVLLYDAKRGPLPDAYHPNLNTVRLHAEREFDHLAGQARIFYETALLAKQLRHNRTAMFLLHQATEQMYQAIILTHTGFKPTTHNLDKLRRYTVRLSIDLALIFPKDSPEETRLFSLLVASYVGGRYKNDFTVTDVDLNLLICRIEKLISIGGTICIHRLKFIDKLILSPNSNL